MTDRGKRHVVSSVLAALYLRGLPGRRDGTTSRNWPKVTTCLLSACPALDDAAEALRLAGLWAEASVLNAPGVLTSAYDLVSEGRVLCVNDFGYPRRWTDVLGSGAPPALWRLGGVGSDGSPAVAVVGSRSLTRPQTEFAQSVGAAVVGAGRTLVTGGAIGADTAALAGAVSRGDGSRCVVLLPFGIGEALQRGNIGSRAVNAWRRAGVQLLSVAPWGAWFSSAQAMERNALIYAAATHSVVVAARFRVGGTWHGSVDALRRRLTNLVVCDDGDVASRALIALGGRAWPAGADGSDTPVDDALREVLSWPSQPAQPELFGAAVVRESVPGFDVA